MTYRPNCAHKEGAKERSFVSMQLRALYMETYVHFIVAGDINLQQKKKTLWYITQYFYIVDIDITQQHTQKCTVAFPLRQHLTPTRHNGTVHVAGIYFPSA